MTKWLASVKSLEEANTLLPLLPDILDMKDPARGALGALPVEIVSQIVALINGQCQTSATIGDLPMQADIIATAMIDMTASGVDYVKIGLFPSDNLLNCISELADTVKSLKTPVIAVLFADKMTDIECIQLLKSSGFQGVMVDTAIKNGQGLLDCWDSAQLTAFVNAARRHNMLCGLAGALRIENIASLKPLMADYLGFRSALCQENNRKMELQLGLVRRVQDAISII